MATTSFPSRMATGTILFYCPLPINGNTEFDAFNDNDMTVSRIFYRGKYYDYPLKAMNALRNLGPIEAVRCVLSYVWAQIRPPKNQDTAR